jgi:hypothetical protein
MREWVIEGTIKIYAFLLPIGWTALALSVFVLLPLAVPRKTRGFAGVGLFVSSYVFGATTWFLGAAVTFSSFGWIGLIIGLLIFGVGVVPLGIVGAFFKLGINELAVSLCVMLALTFVARLAGAALCAADQNTSPRPQPQLTNADLVEMLGELMERHPMALLGTTRLPAPKEKMKGALKQAYLEHPAMQDFLHAGYLQLSQFQDGIGDRIIEPAIGDGAKNPTELAAELATGERGKKLQEWLAWSKVSLAEMEILSDEWKNFIAAYPVV